MALRSASMSSGCSERMTVSHLVWEDDTYWMLAVLRTTSLMWLSHIPHIMPSIFKIVSTIVSTSGELLHRAACAFCTKHALHFRHFVS